MFLLTGKTQAFTGDDHIGPSRGMQPQGLFCHATCMRAAGENRENPQENLIKLDKRALHLLFCLHLYLSWRGGG